MKKKFDFLKYFFITSFIWMIICIAATPICLAANIFSDNLNNTNKWETEGTWAVTGTEYHSDSSAITDSPGSVYQNSINDSLTLLNSIDLSGSTRPTLVFWHKCQIEADFDYAYLEISINGGTDWTILNSYTGVFEWKREQIDLAAYNSETDLKIRFRLETDKTVFGDGWYIDDISISELPAAVLEFNSEQTSEQPTSIDLSWTQSMDSDFASYNIYRSTTSGVSSQSTPVATISDQSQLSYTDKDLTPETTYYYKVYVFNSYDLAAGSKEISVPTGKLDNSFPFTDDFEGSLIWWNADAPWGIADFSSNESYNGYPSKVWTDSPDGAYDSGTDKSLKITVNLGAAVMPFLSFWHKYSIESNNDFLYIEIQEDGTTSWKRLYFVTGTSSSWLKEKIDLSSYAGKKITIRFRLVSNTNGIQSDGWYMDDLSILETDSGIFTYPFYDDFESASSIDNWHSSSWGIIADAHSGINAFTDSPEGNYGQSTNSQLILANSINLSDAIHPQLTFWHKYNFFDEGYDVYDYGRVYLSTYKGQSGTWTLIGSFNKSQSSWKYNQIDLSDWASLPDVRIKFVIEDNARNANDLASGWTIDDVSIEEAPVDVLLLISSSNQSQVVLSWDTNTDNDFKRYEIYRSTSPGVSRSSLNIVNIAMQDTITYTDKVAFVQPVKYYYRMWVIDNNDNISMGSNEVQASYTIPENYFPFMEDAESGVLKWSFGWPWGQTTNQKFSGQASWTDSPGINYSENANTTLVTYLNLTDSLNPVLTFWHRYFLEEAHDYLKLEISTNDGIDWTAIRSYTGIEKNWNQEHVNLKDYAGHGHLGLRFRLISDSANQQDGWYMDDLKIVEEPIRVSYPFTDKMESDLQPWFYDSPWSLVPLHADASHSNITTVVWTDSPEGSYQKNADASLQITIDLGAAEMPVLTFMHSYSLEANQDFAYIEVRVQGNSSWRRIYFTTGVSSWKKTKVDLTEYAGKQIDLRFRLVANDNGIQSDGWYIDDISFDETKTERLAFPFSDNMEGPETVNNWHSSSWDLVPAAHSGNNTFTDSPVGNYGNYVYSSLILANAIDFSDALHPQLTFWHKYSFFDEGYDVYDYGKVYLSPNNGQPGTWTQIASFNKTQSSWKYSQIDLSQWAGLANVRIMFQVQDIARNANETSSGWDIDDVTLEEAPVDVELNIIDSSQNHVDLSWTPNEENDFARYEIFRLSTQGVSRSSLLVASITDSDTVSFSDPVAPVQPGSYYYRMWVIDSNENVSMGSNEVHATYTVPENSYPFQEDGESGMLKWSGGHAWGLTDVNPHSGNYCWTDSPDTNYPENANTALEMYINLSGSKNPVLSFWNRFSLEQNVDYLKIEVSTDDGQSWAELINFTGTETEWNQEHVNLTAYAGHAHLGLRFRLIANETNQQDGWFMDDLTISEENVLAKYPFVDDVESGILYWFYHSPWGRATNEAHSGVYSWSDSPSGSYAANSSKALNITVDLGSSVMPVLTFWQKYALEENHDYGYIEINEIGSSSWFRASFITGTSSAWVQEKLDLSSYAGKQINIRFRLSSDSNNIQSDGWYIDDISIAETNTGTLPYPFTDDMDSPETIQNWHSSSWELVSDSHSGTYAYTDSPKGNYGYTTFSTLILGNSIDLRNAVHPKLSFWHKYSFYDEGYGVYDYGRVYLSTYNGQSGTWTQISQFSKSAGWGESQIDLSQWTGLANIRIKFVIEDYIRNENDMEAGWTIDDVRIGEDTSIPTYIIQISGDAQTGQVNMPLSEPFVARILDENSIPTGGIPVIFEITSGNGTLSVTNTFSGEQGEVHSLLSLGPDSGINTVNVMIEGSAEKVIFSAKGYSPGQAVYMHKISGGGQVANIDTLIPNPLIVKVTDIVDTPVSGETVYFSNISGQGTLSIGEIQTDSNGLASVGFTLGSEPGMADINASIPGVFGSPVSFIVHAVLPGGYLGDMDGDSIPDDWEQKFELDPRDPSDASLDPDNDNLTSLQEYSYGTNPQVSDTDTDGLPDDWETKYGLNPINSSDANNDNDSDGITNLDEFLASTIPVFMPHYQIAGITDNWMDFFGIVTINGVPADMGDEIAVRDPDGVICGKFTVTNQGQYGFMHVYKDDANTSGIDEGAQVGDELTFWIWDASEGIEVNTSLNVINGYQPLVWTFDGDTSNVHLDGAGLQSIPLHEGWNLFSFSVKRCFYIDGINSYDDGPPDEPMLTGTIFQKVSELSEILSSIDGKYSVVRSFDSRGAHTFDPNMPYYSDMKYIAGGYGYWIKMNAQANLEINGIRALPSDTLELSPGWNLVGCWHTGLQYSEILPQIALPSGVSTPVNNDILDILAAIRDNYVVIRSFDVTGAHTFDPLWPQYSDLDYIAPGYGLWIKMKTADVLSY
ncbi:secreted protein containing Peptidase M6, immune inhibitor A [Candidatus Magnetomorum sp. HK-1]|nr:secreted protein containing Peptidase M6, immune inhibitor A [Candidatus Magnetomorum sp. HK-1]